MYLEAIISAGITSARDWSDQATPSGKLKCHHHHYQPPLSRRIGPRAAQVTTALIRSNRHNVLCLRRPRLSLRRDSCEQRWEFCLKDKLLRKEGSNYLVYSMYSDDRRAGNP